MLPAQLAGVSQGRQPAAKDMPADRVADGKYVRPLRDYQVLFGVPASPSHAAGRSDRRHHARPEAGRRRAGPGEAAGRGRQAGRGHGEGRRQGVAAPARRRGRVSARTLEQELDAAKAAIDELIEEQPGHGRPNRQAAIGGRAAHRPAHPCHGAVRCGRHLARWASTIATTTARSRAGAVSRYAPHTVVGAIIAVNVAIWLVDVFSPMHRDAAGGRPLAQRSDGRPRRHAHPAVAVVAVSDRRLRPLSRTVSSTFSFNMLVLFFLGRDVEEAYGRRSSCGCTW